MVGIPAFAFAAAEREDLMKSVRMIVFLLAVLALASLYACASADVVFSEVLSSSAFFNNGRHDDWVELHNTGSGKVSLSGWYLSNKKNDLRKWAFPESAAIDGNGYLVVYCTDDETITGGPRKAVYAPFNISSGGEKLYLTDPDGNTTVLSLGKQFGNVSSGVPEGEEEWLFLEEPTPGKKNAVSGYRDRAPEPVILTEAGFYEGSVAVEISAPEGFEIRYTLDCSTPSRESALYSGPIPVDQTTVIRARCFAGDLLGSAVAGSTFFIDDPSPVAVVSLYTDKAYLYSETKGIMVEGNGGTPNYKQNWEYPCQIEYFSEDLSRQLSQMGTVRVSGYSSRPYRQKSLAVYARSALGGKTFDCGFFEDRDYTSYSAILLRSTNSDARSCRMRDAVLTQMSEGLGLYYQAARPIVLYLNGEYFGHYNLREKANKDSLAQWEGITDEKVIDGVDILECSGMSEEWVIRGSNADWVELMNFCKTCDLNNEDELQYVLDRLDVDSLFNYVIFNCMIGNGDVGNVRMYRFPGGKWKYMLHDIEAGCMRDSEEPVSTLIRRKTDNANYFAPWALGALMEVPEYRDMFLKRVAEIVESNFLYDTWVGPIYDRWFDTLSELLPRHIAKFKSFTMDEWRTNVNASRYFARTRPKMVISAICNRLDVTSAEKEAYFGRTFELLKTHNSR